MANRRFQRMQALQKEVKKLHVVINTDGSGDVSSIEGVGIDSVQHAANVYTITLEDKYNKFLGAHVLPAAAANFHLDSEDVDGAKTVAIEFSAVQASGKIHVELSLKNTSVEK